MVSTTVIGNKMITPQQNNYSGVKISIHNPAVNVPAQQVVQRPPEYKIYQYDETPKNTYPQPYLPKKSPVVTPSLPEPQPARDRAIIEQDIKTELAKLQDVINDLPASVLEDFKIIKIPEPVFVEETPIVKEENNAEIVTDTVEPEQPITEEPVVKEEQAPEVPVETVIQEEQAIEPSVETVAQKAQEETNAIVEQKTEEQPNIEVKQETAASQEVAPVNVTNAAPINKSPIKIIPPIENASPLVNYEKVTQNLQSANYDIQALQLRDIALSAIPNSEIPLKHYVTEQNFLDVIDIVSKDASNLAGPTEAQTQIRTKIIENHFAKLNQPNVPEKDIVYPHKLTEQDINYANTLSPREMAERNREYGIIALSMMSKHFTDRVENSTGTVVPITDVPGMAALVNTLKNENFVIRLAALDSLEYLQKAEYENELRPIYEALVRTDSDENVKRRASEVLANLDFLASQTSKANAA